MISIDNLHRAEINPAHRYGRYPYLLPQFIELSTKHFDRTDTVPGIGYPIETFLNEACFLYSVVMNKKPANVLEIGRYKGHSTFALACGIADLNSGGKVYSVDIEDRVTQQVKVLLGKSVVYVNESSLGIDKHPLLSAVKFQVCFIDGDHSYDMIVNDLECCINLSDTEACIMLHDANKDSTRQAVNTMLERYDSLSDGGEFGLIRLLNLSKR